MATHTVAVVLAGGIGARLGAGRPKQLVEVGGRSILARAIAAFDAHPAVDEVVVVMAPAHVREAAAIAAAFRRVGGVGEGGGPRTASAVAGLRVLEGQADEVRVLFHDAARPFVDAAVIDRVVEALDGHEAVAVGVPASDTMVVVEDCLVVSMPPRE